MARNLFLRQLFFGVSNDEQRQFSTDFKDELASDWQKVPRLDESFLIRDDFLYFQLFIRRLVQPKFATKLPLKTDYNLYVSEIESIRIRDRSLPLNFALKTDYNLYIRIRDRIKFNNCLLGRVQSRIPATHLWGSNSFRELRVLVEIFSNQSVGGEPCSIQLQKSRKWFYKKWT